MLEKNSSNKKSFYLTKTLSTWKEMVLENDDGDIYLRQLIFYESKIIFP